MRKNWQYAVCANPRASLKDQTGYRNGLALVAFEPALPAGGKLCLEFREVSPTVVDHDHLAVDDRLAGYRKGAGNFREAFGPVEPVTGIDFLPASVEMHLNPVTVVLDFVKPLFALRRAGLQRMTGLSQSMSALSGFPDMRQASH
jgi:hypothetical protein